MTFTGLTRRALACALAIQLVAAPALASQGSLVMPTVGPLSGLAFLNDANAAYDALATCNSGATQPLNAATAPSPNQVWCDTSVAGKTTKKQYDGTNWVVLGVIDDTTHIWTPPVGGGEATIASGSTVDLGSVPQAVVDISGTTTITSFGSSAVLGQVKFLRFTGALTLTHNATSLILPANGNNISTAAGDTAAARYLGGGNWAVIWYSQANGTALLSSGTIAGALSLTGAASITLSANTNDWAPGATKSVIRLTVNNASGINVTGIAAPANDGNIIIIDVQPASTGPLTLVTQSGSSTAANRFLSPTTVIKAGQQAVLKYDTAAARWWIIVPAVISDARQGVTSSGRQIIASPADGSSGAFTARAPDARDSVYGPKAWVVFSLTGGSEVTKASYNVVSVVRNSTGVFTITFTSNMADANYAPTGVCQKNAASSNNDGAHLSIHDNTTPTTSAIVMSCTDVSGSQIDAGLVSVVIFGN